MLLLTQYPLTGLDITATINEKVYSGETLNEKVNWTDALRNRTNIFDIMGPHIEGNRNTKHILKTSRVTWNSPRNFH